MRTGVWAWATEATVSGTPAIDRPFLAARTDFYLVTAGLAPLRLALEQSLRLRRVLSRTLLVAIAYNVATVSLAYAGLMTPLLCALLMPLSSLSTILMVVVMLGEANVSRGATSNVSAASPEARLQAV